jgi:hypothetical protein
MSVLPELQSLTRSPSRFGPVGGVVGPNEQAGRALSVFELLAAKPTQPVHRRMPFVEVLSSVSCLNWYRAALRILGFRGHARV